MNKKILLFTLLFMLFSVSFVSARMCDTDNVLEVLRKALYIYYTDPESSSFTPAELKDLLGFYVGIQTGQVTIDCTEQENNIDRANALPDNIPSCSDGTKYGKCSSTKPMYCYAGRLVPRCKLCGCPTGQWCDITYVYTEKSNKGQWGKCYPGTNVACVVDSDCGTSTFVYHCSDDDILRDYIKYICLNLGETYSSCTTETTTELIQDCKILGRECVEGKNECQTHITCFVDSDCGTSHYEGAYYCSDDNSIFRDYTKYICLNPGETYSSCTREYTTELIEDCEVTGKECVEGQAECQISECEPSGAVVNPDGSAYWENGIGRIEWDKYYFSGCTSTRFFNVISYLPSQYMDICLNTSRAPSYKDAWIWKNMSHMINNYTYLNNSYIEYVENESFSGWVNVENGSQVNYPYEEWYFDWVGIPFSYQSYNGRQYYCLKNINLNKDQQYKFKLYLGFPFTRTEGGWGCSEQFGVMVKRSVDTIADLDNCNYIELL